MEILISVIIPAYNEAEVIEETLDRLLAFLKDRYPAEIIVVDDGSEDRTADIVSTFTKGHPEVRLIENDRIRGKGYSVRRGVLESRGEIVTYTDADLVYGVENFEQFLRPIRGGSDMVIASRTHPESRFILHPRHLPYILMRHLIGRTFVALVRAFLGLKISDPQSGMKCLRGSVAREIFQDVRLHDYAFEVEVLYIARRRDLPIVEMPIVLRCSGERSSVRLVRDSLKNFIGLVRIVRRSWRERAR